MRPFALIAPMLWLLPSGLLSGKPSDQQPPPFSDAVEVEVVSVDVIVTGPDRRPVRDLRREDFARVVGAS